MNTQTGISAPWVSFYNEIVALFGEDPQIRITFDSDAHEVKLYVNNAEKADALMQLLPATKTFGKVTMKITVIPENKKLESKIDLFQKAFKDNPAVSYIRTTDKGIYQNLAYVVFKKKVVQYYNDDLSNIYGICSTLYQNIADDIFGVHDNIFFCTDKG